jgi:hypothetical protein
MKCTYYVAQEMAMAPGIVKEWPEIIKHPKSKNGRLKKIDIENIDLFKAYKLCFQLLSIKQKIQILEALQKLKNGVILTNLIESDLLENKTNAKL